MEKEKQYVAASFMGYNTAAVTGTLREILDQIEGNDEDVEDYRFFPMESQVKVRYERKLVLEG